MKYPLLNCFYNRIANTKGDDQILSEYAKKSATNPNCTEAYLAVV